MTLVTFEDYVPVKRFPPILTPWTQVRIDEAPDSINEPGTEDDAWEEIDSFDLDPVDADPTDPVSRSFSTDNANHLFGWYRVVFLDSQGNVEYTSPIKTFRFRPTVEDIADLLFARTTTPGGNPLGIFNELTTPTADRVERAITRAYRHVINILGQIDTSEDPELEEDVKNVISYYAAMLIEVGSVKMNKERYDELQELYDAGIKALIETVGGEGAAAGDELGGENSPVWYFPEPGMSLRIPW